MSNSLFKKFKIFTSAMAASGGGGSSVWGTITGLLSNQTDLKAALDAKLASNTPITGATKTKITYDANGLVTSGADATTADIAASTNKNYVTDAQAIIISNTSNTNTGDETETTILAKLALQSGSINIDFGKDGVLSENDLVITTVPSLWVTATTKIQCFAENDGIDHTDEDVYLENIVASAYNIIPNTSFDIIAVAHNLTWGRYKITYKETI